MERSGATSPVGRYNSFIKTKAKRQSKRRFATTTGVIGRTQSFLNNSHGIGSLPSNANKYNNRNKMVTNDTISLNETDNAVNDLSPQLMKRNQRTNHSFLKKKFNSTNWWGARDTY